MGKKPTKSKKPGVMIYFEILPQLEMLKPLQRLAVYEAIMAYGRDGTEPVLKREAELVWRFVRPIMDRDDERYKRVVSSRVKAGKARGKQMKEEAQIRKQNASAEQVAPYAEHMLLDAEHMVSPLNTDSQSTISNPQSANINLQSANINPQSAIANPQLSNSNTQSPPFRERACLSEAVGITGGVFLAPSIGEVRDFVLREELGFDPESFVDYYTANGWTIGGAPMKDWRAVARRWGRRERENGRSEEVRFGNYG